jgi:tetratricopeptide (TPR) repeat protein
MIRLQPGNANTFRLLASACFRDKQSDTGLYFLNKSYSLNSSDYRTVARLGEELTDRKNYSRADSVLCTFLANDSTHLDVISPAIRLAWQTRDYSRCTELGKILMDHNTVSNSFNYVIAAQYRLKQYRQCINTYDFLAPLNSAGPNILYFAALAHTELKNYDSSNALLQTCIDIATSVSLDDYYTGKSVNYEAMKQYKPAIAALDTAWYLFQRPLRQYSIGRIYDVHLHNKPMAMRHYKRFLLTHPETADEKSIYKYLQSYIGK